MLLVEQIMLTISCCVQELEHSMDREKLFSRGRELRDQLRQLMVYFTMCILANVNSRGTEMVQMARPSVICLSSVTFVRPTQAVQIFGHISMAFGTLAIL